MTATSAISTAQAILRFLLEVLALTSWAVVGWTLSDGAAGAALAVVLPVAAAAAWGTFRVPGDQSAKGHAPVAVPGLVRLLVEIDVLLGAAVLTMFVVSVPAGAMLAAAVVAHYVATVPRIRWLLAH